MAQRLAMVTAAAGGIGRAVTQQLLARNVSVVAVDIDQTALDRLGNEVNSAALRLVQGDMTSADDVERVFDMAAGLGDLHVLVNGVGSQCGSSLLDLTPSTWQRMFELNLSSVFLATRAALPSLKRATGDRVVVNISSTLAAVADPTTLAYGAFKAGLEQFTRSLALELAPDGIRALAVAPGPVTATAGEAAYDSPEFTRLNPLGRFATAEEIGEIIAFLASPAAAYMTGVVVRVDGGDSALGVGWGPLQTLLK